MRLQRNRREIDMRIMAFAPHPDDELICAGTLAKYKDAGHEVAIVIVTNGEAGSFTMSKEEVASVRQEEARASAKVIGAEFFWMGYPDEFLFNNEKVRIHFIDIIRQFEPDIIICPDKDADYHPDHTTTGQIVWDIRIMSSVPNIETGRKACKKIPELYFMDTAAGINFVPEFYVDITKQWDKKAAMIGCHKSQQSNMMDLYGVTHEEFIRIQSMFRGFQAGCKYAEAFRKPKFFPGDTKPENLLL